MILILVGAFAKSAQIPLHTWLPDAMEGPTPVSALIHAATMVTAGVYLIGRLHPLFEWAPTAADVGAITGGVTLLIAGTIGLVVTDVKRVIAYSTMSQIGYMIMAVSAAAYAGAFFHLMTHAFFKALLFMAAGSLIAAMGGEQSLEKMRGFRKAMPFTFGCFVIGSLALSAFPLFSGFFSKDAILYEIGQRGGWWIVLYVAGFVGSIFTVFYTWRLVFRAFYGEPCEEARELEHGHLYHPPEPVNPATGELEDDEVGFPGADHHIAERTGQMRIAMSILAVLALLAGVVFLPFGHHRLVREVPRADVRRLDRRPPGQDRARVARLRADDGRSRSAASRSSYRIWVAEARDVGGDPGALRALHKLFVNKWYFDELIDLADRAARSRGPGAGRVTASSGSSSTACSSAAPPASCARARPPCARSRPGLLRGYAALVIGGLAVVLLYFLIRSA